MALQRAKHWATRAFHEFLLARAKTPFAWSWGTNDCCLFAADAVQAITGVDIADDFRGLYDDEASAFALIAKVTGGTTVADAAAHCAVKHGLVELQHPLKAQSGDLVVMENGGQLIAGIVHLNGRLLISVAAAGPVRLSILSVVRAWHY
jgi:hypothetical protein